MLQAIAPLLELGGGHDWQSRFPSHRQEHRHRLRLRQCLRQQPFLRSKKTSISSHCSASIKPREVAKTAFSRGKAAMKTSGKPEKAETSSKTEKSKTKERYPEELNSWQKLVKRIQDRKRWSQLGHTLKYSKNGLPKKEGPATGFGKHIGRWSWREIAFCW